MDYGYFGGKVTKNKFKSEVNSLTICLTLPVAPERLTCQPILRVCKIGYSSERNFTVFPWHIVVSFAGVVTGAGSDCLRSA